jgi:hypothetical protein
VEWYALVQLSVGEVLGDYAYLILGLVSDMVRFSSAVCVAARGPGAQRPVGLVSGMPYDML